MPFSWPSYQGPSSKVITKPKDWCDAGILVPHEAIRWWNAELLKALAAYDPVSQPETSWKTQVLFDFLQNYYCVCIHHHHHAEETIYTPGIEKKMGKPMPGAIKEEHKELLDRLEKLLSFRSSLLAAAFSPPRARAALQEFKAFFTSLVEFMEQHLAEEETNYPQALRAVMTEKEDAELVGQIIQGLGLEGNKKFLPAIVYAMCMWKGEEKTMEWLANNVPPPIQMLFKKCWIHDFYENQLRVLEALTKDEEFIPTTPSCDVCALM
jgi:hemerythrin-like domain-containing protein